MWSEMHGDKIIMGGKWIGREGNNQWGDFCNFLGLSVVEVERQK